MIKKIIILFIILSLTTVAEAAFWKKKEKASLFLSANDPRVLINGETVLKNDSVFSKNRKIYFLVHNPEGFKSDYIKYQIIKQDDKAHIGGYTRIRNVNKRVKNKRIIAQKRAFDLRSRKPKRASYNSLPSNSFLIIPQ